MTTKAPRRQANVDLLSQVEFCDDPVEYLVRCMLAMAPNLSEEIARAAENHVRLTHGESAESRRRFISGRNAAIRRDYLAGERIGLLARRYELTERRILQIIKAAG